MGQIEPPRRESRADDPAEDRPEVPEPPTDRALWPTFLRRTLEAERLRPPAPALSR